jgi:succinate dehydrogenase / fumarate reductase membrane anchor subunit
VALVLWAVYSALKLASFSYPATVAWLQSPFNAVPTAALIGVGCYHMQLGMRTIIEDYIARRFTLSVLLILNLFACWIIAAVGILSILKVAFGGGAF